jgi:hypothetical protein
MCPISTGFRDGAVSLYNSKIVDNKEILRTVSNTGIYCSCDKVDTVYPGKGKKKGKIVRPRAYRPRA